MAFRFSLAAVLRLRESVEESEERALEAIELEVQRTLREIERLCNAIEASRATRDRALQQAISGGQLHSLQCEEQWAEQDRELRLGRLRELEQRREEQMRVYQAAHRDRQMLSDMRQKQKDVYQREWLREEQKRLDGIFMARRHRRM